MAFQCHNDTTALVQLVTALFSFCDGGFAGFEKFSRVLVPPIPCAPADQKHAGDRNGTQYQEQLSETGHGAVLQRKVTVSLFCFG